MTDVVTLSPKDLAARLERGEDLLLLDVRERDEHEICRIAGSILIPMSELSVRIAELDPDRPTVCICHHGVRSAHVAAALARLDFAALYNLSGGVDRWARDVDPSMARY